MAQEQATAHGHASHGHGAGAQKSCCGGHGAGSAAAETSGATIKDPVCGMTVDPATAKHHASHAGHDYHFCSNGCRSKFVADPGST